MVAAGNRIATPLHPGDADEAREPLLRAPLKSQNLQFAAPDTAAWKRLRKTWGQPDYLLTVELARNEQGCWDDFPLELKSAAAFAPTSAPAFGYLNQCGGRALGLRFETSANLQITVPADAKVPPAEIVILPVWPGDMKQRLGEAYLDERLSDISRWVLGAGVLLALAGGFAALSVRGL